MLDPEKFDAPDADIILRALGPPSRDFRVHKLLLSLASPVFKDMFSLPQFKPDRQVASDDTETPSAVGIDVVEVTDPPKALEVILRMIYPFTPPSLNCNLDILVQCLIIADKYEIKGATARLRATLARTNVTQSLRVYAIASRFGFADIVDSSTSDLLSLPLTKIPELPDDFEFIPATRYHKLVRHHENYLEVVVEVINQTPLKSKCSDCPGTRLVGQEIFRLRLAHLILTGTPVDARACLQAWVKAYGSIADCEADCVPKFIFSAVSRIDKGSVNPVVSPPKKSALRKRS